MRWVPEERWEGEVDKNSWVYLTVPVLGTQWADVMYDHAGLNRDRQSKTKRGVRSEMVTGTVPSDAPLKSLRRPPRVPLRADGSGWCHL